jgi:hypothetical protein
MPTNIKPARVQKAVQVPTLAQPPKVAQVAKVAQPPKVPFALTPPPRRVEALSTPLPSLESTQTMRALTPLELEDPATLHWFVIQLSLSEEGFDPDSLPNLDIFGEYRLYSVAGLDQGRLVHALRLGFFAEEGAAAAVASYLAAYYEKPTVKRVSIAERERFSDQRVEARKDIGATGQHAVIEITNELRERRSSAATVTPLPMVVQQVASSKGK